MLFQHYFSCFSSIIFVTFPALFFMLFQHYFCNFSSIIFVTFPAFLKVFFSISRIPPQHFSMPAFSR